LQELLAGEVTDLFPEAQLLPMRESEPSQPERTMTAMPFLLDPGPSTVVVSDPGWTPLRVGLALAWLAALIALLAVGLGGWSLLNLSERRIRFVSAVTHELRTPLTTLRLYLDMLVHGLVRDDRQRGEYLHTLHAETDRLNRLVANVLDFSRLENQRPRLNRVPVSVADLLEQARCTWAGRCQDADKELIVENSLAADASLRTDRELVQQVLGNLIDNACKYSRGAEDHRLWVRARGEWDRVVFEIEDRGPGVPVKDRRLIFRAFRRGRGSDETAGGVGLGLALARRWTELLGGRLTLQSGSEGCGACFRVELPLEG
jgi:signal transduction histidine kinase